MNGVAIPVPDALPRNRRGARPAGAIRLGSEEHLRLLCLELLTRLRLRPTSCRVLD
jgi:hypothetical protein